MKIASLPLALLVAAAPMVGLAQAQTATKIPTNIAGTFSIAAPPAGFDVINASDEDLAFYGFPPRPDKDQDANNYARWAKAMLASKKRIVPVLEQTSISHGPAKLVKNADLDNSVSEVTKSSSSNWSGYANLGGSSTYGPNSFYFVESDFVVPVARQAFGKCTGSWDYGSTWVGIDGYGSGDVLQAGVEFDAYCSGSTTSTFYSPWYEWYPFNEVRINNLAIAPGDDYFVEVWNTSATQGYAYLVNENTNTSVDIGFNPPSGTTLKGNSAEWITERPGVNGSLATLTNYIADPYWGAVAYTHKYAKFTPNGTHSYAITMLDNNGKPISYPTLWSAESFLMQDEGSAW